MPKHFLAICLCIVTLYGCQSSNQSSLPRQTADSAKPTPAIEATTSSAEALRQRYSTPEDRQSASILRRAAAALNAGNFLAASQQLLQVPVNPLLADVYHRLLAATELGRSNPFAAAESLLLTRATVVADVTLINGVCSKLGASECVVLMQVILQQLANVNTRADQDAVWATLQNTSMRSLSNTAAARELVAKLTAQALRMPELGATRAKVQRTVAQWIALRRTMTAAGSVPQAQSVWADWQRQNANHPAALTPPTALAQLMNYTAPTISVMLPMTGRLAAVGRAVRDGFVAGYLADLSQPTAATKPSVNATFFDSNVHSDAKLAQLSQENASSVIVGPLVKQRAQGVVAALSLFTVPANEDSNLQSILLLNRVGDTSVLPANTNAPTIHQFAAAIEDEALTLSENLKALGHQRLLVITNQKPWATRAKRALLEQWPGPTSVAEFQRPREITGAVGKAMGVEASQNRRDQLAKLLDEEIEFLPRERKDIDAVVTFTDGLESTALVPALKFHFADELPVFATSQTARAADLGALAGFQVTELPLLAEPRATGQNLSAAFKLADSPLVELYALGLDAYRLATWTQWFQQNRAALAADTAVTLEAASGTLTLSREGLIKRALTLAAIDPRGRLQTSSKQPR